jgi:peptidoglycan/LPS O-acetylase OafA/YrhL
VLQTDGVVLKRRDPTIDGLKFVAAGAIVMVHVAMSARPGPLREFVMQASYTALFFFFMVAGYFHGEVGGRGSAWLWKRFVRLAVPYAVWSLVYLAWNEGSRLYRGQTVVMPDPVVFIFFAGANQVLWSLPMLFACALIADVLVRTPTQRRVLIVVFAALAVAAYWLVPQSALPDNGIRQFIMGARWPLTYLLGMELRASVRRPERSSLYAVVAVVGVCGAGLITVFLGRTPPLLAWTLVNAANCAAAYALLAGARSGMRWLGVDRFAWGGDYLLGIYLAHHLWLEVLVRFVPSHSMPAALWMPFAWAVCFGMAILTTRLLLSSRYTRRAVS